MAGPSPEQIVQGFNAVVGAANWVGYRVVPGANNLHGALFGVSFFELERGESASASRLEYAGMAAGETALTVLTGLLGSSTAQAPARAGVPAAVHGNSIRSTRAQHVYRISRTDTAGNTTLYKYGISGGKISAAGKSGRAQSQVHALNRAAGGQYRYASDIVRRISEGSGAREKALELEAILVYWYEALTGAKPPGNIRP